MDSLEDELKLMKDQISHINHQIGLRFKKKQATILVINEHKRLEEEVSKVVYMVKENDAQVDRLFRLAVAGIIKKFFFWMLLGILFKLKFL